MTILAEARGEGEAGMYGVACVIRKRMDEKRSVRHGGKMPAVGVCLQSSYVASLHRRVYQFSCWSKSDKELFKLLVPQFAEVRKVLKDVMHIRYP